MSVRLLIIGDTHFKHTRLQEGTEFVTACVARAKEEAPDAIVCLGDTLDTHNIVRVQPHNLAYRFLKQLSEVAPTYLIIGNHDLINHKQYLTDNHVFNPYKQWPRLTVVDRPLVVELGGYTFAMCPYVPNGMFAEALHTLVDDRSSFHWEVDVDCVFAHQEFHGCRMSSVVSADGDRWSLAFPPVVSGHIHEAQDLDEDNVFYPGSVLQHSFGETAEKHLWLLTFDESLSPADRLPFRRKLISLALKRKKLIKMAVADVAKSFDFRELHSAYIKLELRGVNEQFRLFRKSPLYAKLVASGVRLAFVADLTAPSEADFLQKDTMFGPNRYRRILEELVRGHSRPDVAQAYRELVAEDQHVETDVDTAPAEEIHT